MQTSLMHKYLQAMEVEVQAGFGGTDNEPVLVSMCGFKPVMLVGAGWGDAGAITAILLG